MGSEQCLCVRECARWRGTGMTFWWHVWHAWDLLLQGHLCTHTHVDLCSSFQNYKNYWQKAPCPKHLSTLLHITQTLSSTGTATRRSLCEVKAKALLHSTSVPSNHTSTHLFLAVQPCWELSAHGSSWKDTHIHPCTHIGITIFVRVWGFASTSDYFPFSVHPDPNPNPNLKLASVQTLPQRFFTLECKDKVCVEQPKYPHN